MKDQSFEIWPVAETARAPFSYDFSLPRGRAFFWNVRDATGRAVGRANTRAGARIAVRILYARHRSDRAEALKPRRWTPEAQLEGAH